MKLGTQLGHGKVNTRVVLVTFGNNIGVGNFDNKTYTCYLIALGSGKAMRFVRQLSGDGVISEQHIFSSSLWCGTPHM